jgi:GNAT superfamily N-acetyltransferase
VTQRDLVRQIEATGYRSWPARELELYDGWQLRYADGFSRRGNSVCPVGASTLDLETKLVYCIDWFRKRGLGLVVRQTPLSETGLEEELANRGFALEGRTNVMVADIEGGAVADAVELVPQPTDTWWATMAELWAIESERRKGWRNIIESIRLPAAHGLYTAGDRAVAAGLGVVDGRWMGLFEIIVAEGWRRRGIGRDLAASLLSWGSGLGAQRAFLQVVEGNGPALALYEGLGFRVAYRYWYRRAPLGHMAAD